jgi:hypothetical protein
MTALAARIQAIQQESPDGKKNGDRNRRGERWHGNHFETQQDYQ